MDALDQTEGRWRQTGEREQNELPEHADASETRENTSQAIEPA